MALQSKAQFPGPDQAEGIDRTCRLGRSGRRDRSGSTDREDTMGWNKRQQAVLDSIKNDKNVIVSAAAGSGKTAVLVERIVNSVAEGRCGIDEILVVTFTKAAAAQMKAKILTELEKRAESSEDPRLIRQLSVAANADISTIDSFCNRVVRENFQMAGVDPAFGMLDSGEGALLQEEVLDTVMDTLYQDPVFVQFAGAFTRRGYQDDALRQAILRIYAAADAFAEPEKWLAHAASGDWMPAYLREIRKYAAQVKAVLEQEADIYRAEAEPDRREVAGKIVDLLMSDMAEMDQVLAAETLEEAGKAMDVRAKSFALKQYSAVYDPMEMEALSNRRKEYRKKLKGFLEGVENLPAEQAEREATISQLLRGEHMLRESLMQEKKRRKKYAFNDIAHFAYRVLYDPVKGEPTSVGRSYAERYRYIYIDEYQDGSDIQEQILNSVARVRDGHPVNIFMVGDVKQSIYRFRQARPQLFLDKVDRYQSHEDQGSVLYLNQNYRSRKEILDATNHIFRHLMRRDFGGIDYDETVQLNVPDDYSEAVDPEQLPELLLCEAAVKDAEGVPVDRAVLEVRMIGRRIQSLVQEGTCHYGDIVILQSALTNMAPMLREYEGLGIPVQLEDPKAYFDAEEVVILLSVLQIIDNSRQDIPYAAVLHSPITGCDDTELARLAMRRSSNACSLYDTAADWLDMEDAGETPEEELLLRKLRKLHVLLARWKKQAAYLSIAELLDNILEDTGFREEAARMPDGGKRLNNLTQLGFKAEDFEKAGNHGLFTFLRYIDQCRIHELEFGDRGSLSEATDSVRICSIHSSKGLEYPVVFVARLAREFYQGAYQGPILVSSDLGIAPNRVRKIGGKYWLSEKGLIRNAINRLSLTEDLHEQLRLLYVAMTRAKKRLFMTGTCSDPEGFLLSLEEEPGTGRVPYTDLVSAKSYLAFLMSVLQADPEEAKKYFRVYAVPAEDLMRPEGDAAIDNKEQAAAEARKEGEQTVAEAGEEAEQAAAEARKVNEGKLTSMQLPPAENAEEAEEAEKVEKAKGGEKAEEARMTSDPVRELVRQLRDSYDYQYPYAASVVTGTKFTVSEIKREALEAAGFSVAVSEDAGRPEPDEKPEGMPGVDENAVPKSAGRHTGVSGADYGTAVHKLMELLPFDRIHSRKDMQRILKELIAGPFFTENLRKVLHVGKIGRFYSDAPDSLFQRMKAARLRGELYTEQQFLVGMPGRRLGEEIPMREAAEESEAEPRVTAGSEDRIYDAGLRFHTDETVALQGVIDGFFLETDEAGEKYAVLMDYKTDRVASPEELILRYHAQLFLYKETIEGVLHIPVREMWLYGFAEGLGEIRVPDDPVI